MRRPARHTGFALCFLTAMLLASDASARIERVRWQHADPSSVDNFRIYWGDSASSLPNSLDVGIPNFDAAAQAFVYFVDVPDALTAYFIVTAWKGGLESPASNLISRPGSGDDPGSDPPPDPDPDPPSGASAGVVGFSLWNAQTDTLVDADFADGDVVPAALSSCAAIEIRANSYLLAVGPGSIKKVFDGEDLGCVAGDHTTYENSHPFAWELEAGNGQFECAPSLADPGQHVLTVTPYDGDACTGAAGTPVSVTFSVELPPPPEPLGVPGQPFIVQ